MTLETGARVGDWTVEGPLEGGPTWLARHHEQSFRRVVLRPLASDDTTDTATRLDALTSLDHPHLERLVGLAQSGESWFVVSDRLHGATLSEVWASDGPSRHLALEVGLAVSMALWFAHQHGVAHGSLDGDHVHLGEDGRIRVTGWFTADRPTLPGDRVAFAELLRWLFADVRPELAAIGDWVTAALDDPGKISLADVRRSLGELNRELRGVDTPMATPAEAESTFFDTDDPDDPAPMGARMPHEIGRYVVVREIGRGGAGVVYEAIDPDLQRRVAIKVLLAGDFARPRDQQRFLNEARAVAQLDHPNIVHIHELDRHEGRAWYAMDLVEGPNLLQVIRERGRLPWRVAVRLAASLARALQHAHEQGLVHRDVKPNNVLLESDHEPQLTDFGLALFTDDAAQSRLTRTGQVLGTPSYMSPEQANGELDRIGPATDVYGVGVVLYEALTGRVPFEGSHPLSIIAAVVEGRAVPPRQLVGGIPRQVEFTCLKAMQVDVDDRYPTAADLAEDLERCLRGEPILATPPTLMDQARWFVRRNRAQSAVLATAVGVALLILLASSAVLGARSVQQTSRAEAEAQTALSSVVARVEELEGQGRTDEANSSWQAFARRPAHRGTPALVEGWWWRAEHLAELGDAEGQIAALGMAYAVAERPRDQERALLRLADEVSAQGALSRLPRIVATLQKRAPRLASTPEVQRLWRDARMSERRLGEAAAVADGPAAAVLSALAGATATEHVASRALPWTGPDGSLVLWSTQGSPELVRGEPSLPVVRRFEDVAWTDETIVVPTERRGTFWVDEGSEVRLLDLHGPHALTLRRYPGGPLRAATLAPDRSGGSVVPVLALGDRLVEPTASGAGLRDVHDATSGAGSTVTDVVTADLDGDGQATITAALAEWDAYDVRVFERADGRTRLVARRKLGAVTDLAVLPHPDGRSSLVASKVDRAPNPDVFGSEHPFGDPAGLWQLDRTGGELDGRRIAQRPCVHLAAGDLDGDGDADLAAQCGGDLGLWVQHESELIGLAIRDLRLLALANVDEDDAIEVLVADPQAGDRVWVLGAGDRALPPLVGDPWVAAPPPKRATEGFRESWQRAEELAYIGQLAQAAEAMEQLAELHWGEALGWAATLRAAAILDAAGHPVRAGELALRAAAALDGLEQVAALHAAAQAWRDAQDPARELEALEQLRDLGTLDRRDVVRLRSLEELARRPRTDIDLLVPPTGAWHIDQPLALHHESGSGLQVEAFGHQTLAHLPVVWDGGSLALDVTLVIDAVEWDGGLQVGLVPAGTEAPFYGIEVRGEASAEGVQPQVRCVTGRPGPAAPLAASQPRTVSFRLFGDEGGSGCGFAGEDGFRVRSVAPVDVMGFGRWDLVIRAIGAPDTVARGTIQAITLTGTAPDPGAPPGDPARLAFASGRTHDAAELLGSGPPDRLLDAAIAADRDDGDALLAAVRSSDVPTALVLTHLLHCRLDKLSGDLQRVLGDDYPWWFAQAWDTALSRPRSGPALAAAVLSSLDGIEDDRPSTPEDREAWIRLGAERTAAALAVGDLPLAQRSIEATLRWFDELRAIDRASRAVGTLRTTVARLYLDQASLQARREESDAVVLDALRHGLRWAPDPLSLLDRATVRPELSRVTDTPLFRHWRSALGTDRPAGLGNPPM